MPPRKREIIDVDPVPVERKWEMDIDELDAQVTEAIGSAPAFTLRLRNGDAISVRPAVLLSDERTAAWMRVQTGEDLDQVENRELRSELAAFLDAETLERVWTLVEPHVQIPGPTINGEPAAPQHIRMARAILGDEDYERLLAGGGSAYRAMWAFQQLNDTTAAEANDPKSLKSSR